MKLLLSWRSGWSRWVVPAAIGAVIAVCATVTLRYSLIWVVALVCGLAAGIGSLLATDFKSYWLAAYALVLPFELKKMIGGADNVQEFVLRYGFPVGELPGPVLYLSDIVLIILLALWLVELKNKKVAFVLPKSHLVAAGFVVWGAVSLINANDFSSALFELVRMVKLYVVYLYAANNLSSPKMLKVVVNCLLVGVLFQGALCVSQFVRRDSGFLMGGLFGRTDFFSSQLSREMSQFFAVSEGPGETDIRASGTAGASDAEAEYFEFLLPISFALFLSMSRFGKAANFAVLMAGLVGLVLTFSRGGLVGGVSGFVAALVLAFVAGVIPLRRFVVLAALVLTGCVAAMPFIYKYLTTRPEAMTARVHLNDVGLAMVRTHPVIGVGLNNHLVVKSDYDNKFYVFPMPTHNHYILLASQVGVPGLLLFLTLLGCFLKASLKAAKSGDRFAAAVSVGVFAGIVAVGVHVLADYIGTYSNMSLLWLFGGLGEGLAKRSTMTV